MPEVPGRRAAGTIVPGQRRCTRPARPRHGLSASRQHGCDHGPGGSGVAGSGQEARRRPGRREPVVIHKMAEPDGLVAALERLRPQLAA
jgi:hypothetical protein